MLVADLPKESDGQMERHFQQAGHKQAPQLGMFASCGCGVLYVLFQASVLSNSSIIDMDLGFKTMPKPLCSWPFCSQVDPLTPRTFGREE